jgi:serine protease Do
VARLAHLIDRRTASGHHRRVAFGAAFLLVGVSLAAAAPATAAPAASATSATSATSLAGRAAMLEAADVKVNPGTVLAAKTDPGIQLIETDYTGTLSVSTPELNQTPLEALGRRLLQQAANGTLDATTPAITEALVDQIARNPFTYFRPSGKVVTQSSSLSEAGTGWVVTPDGYIVTAAHVVQADPAQIKKEFAAAALADITRLAVQGLANSTAKFTDDQIKRLSASITTWMARYLTVGGLKSAVTAQLGVAVAGSKKSEKGRPVEVIAVGESHPGKDVALLKLDGEGHMPTLPVGTDDQVSEGSTLYVAGYPAASTFYSGLSKDSEVQPTITQGPLTAIKSNTSGTPVFQTQAPASPGDSGGPVLNDAGNVVGILVAGAVSDQGVALEGQEFVVPISVITQKLNEHNIKPATSDTTTTYSHAIDEFYLHHYKAAMPLFQQVSALYPGHPYVGDFISKSTAAIGAGKDETPRSIWLWVGIAAGVLVVIAALGVGALLIVRRRRRPADAAASPMGWAGQPGFPQPIHGVPQPVPGGYPPPGYPQPGYPQPGYPRTTPRTVTPRAICRPAIHNPASPPGNRSIRSRRTSSLVTAGLVAATGAAPAAAGAGSRAARVTTRTTAPLARACRHPDQTSRARAGGFRRSPIDTPTRATASDGRPATTAGRLGGSALRTGRSCRFSPTKGPRGRTARPDFGPLHLRSRTSGCRRRPLRGSGV